VTSLKYSPQGDILASGSYDKTIICWNAQDKSYDLIDRSENEE